jgi:phosphoglycolate phosphatase
MPSAKSTYKAVLFDLDGTLINSLQDIADSMNRVLTANGFSIHDYDAYRFFIGRGLRNLVGNVLPETSKTEENIENLFNDLLKDYAENCLRKTALYQGIPELLDKLVERGLKITILSNKADVFTKKIAAKLMNRWPLEVVLGSGGEIPRKPDPIGAFTICERLGLSPKDFLYVGDTSVDMKTAIAAGMYGVGITWGFRSREELVESGAKAIIDSPEELLRLL